LEGTGKGLHYTRIGSCFIPNKTGRSYVAVTACKPLGFASCYREEPLNWESPVAKQINKNDGRGGLAHIALRAADIQKAFDRIQQNGFKLVDKAPRKGSRNTLVFFVHPKATEQASFGYLLEVMQEGAHA
jgi:hypothetical protein